MVTNWLPIPQEAKQQAIARNIEKYGNDNIGTDEQRQFNEKRLQSSPEFVDSELKRAQQVLANRKAAGYETINQENYINHLINLQQQHYANNPNYYRTQELGDFLKSSADAQYNNQRAQLEIARESQIAELKKAYEDAIADGKISVREAERQFEEQKAIIEQQAYLDAERTQLIAQDRGIQNSQQLLGLMSDDNQRTKSLINQNISERDRRINDIRDRINAIISKKNLDIARINAEYDSGLLRARSEADMLYNQGMFNMKHDALRDQRQHDYRLGEMEAQHGYRVNEMGIQHGFDLEKMKIGHQYDLDKMAVQLQNSLRLEGVRSANAIRQAQINMQMQMQKEQQAYELSLKRLSDTYTPGTPEYEANVAKLEFENSNRVNKIVQDSIIQAKTIELLENPNLNIKTASPAEFPGSNLDYLRWSLQNPFTSWNKSEDAKLESVNRARQNLSDFLDNPYGYIFGK